ncbi:membrane protein [Lysobacter maris]|uniref:Membrane protein n=2 Tax=Marilutibacter maris TaxID=1605891 RepID=A0A2U9T7S8_9GAMM|nr:membrane protein [Lysobacter maris]
MPMANPMLLPLMNWARGLRYPTLFKITAVAFAISVLWPFDPIPFIDEIVLGLGTLLLANWKGRNKTDKNDDRVIDAPPGGGGGQH